MLGEDPQRAGRAWRERIGIVLQSCRLDPYLTVAESLALFAGYYDAPRPVDEVIDAVGLDGQGRRPRRQALRRPAAPPRRRHGAGRRPRAALPRRADDRLRPLGPPPGLGGDRRPARPRQDRLPHHPLHGRGPAPRRPGRDHRRRRGRRPRHARGPRRPREPAGDDHLPARRRGGLGRDDDAGRDAERADRRGARRGPRARGARSQAAEPRGRLPGADRQPRPSEPRSCTSSATTRRSSGATRRRSSSPSCSRSSCC